MTVKLKRKPIIKLLYMISYSIIALLIGIGCYFTTALVSIPVEEESLLMLPLIVAIILSIGLTTLIVEWSYSQTIKSLIVHCDSVRVKTLFKSHLYNLSDCKIVQTPFLFGLENIYMVAIKNGKIKRFNINRFEFENFIEISNCINGQNN